MKNLRMKDTERCCVGLLQILLFELFNKVLMENHLQLKNGEIAITEEFSKKGYLRGRGIGSGR